MMQANKDSVYMLSVRAVVLVLIGILSIGAIGGGAAAWFVVRDAISGMPASSHVIERVETPQGNGQDDNLQDIAADVRRGVLGILDRDGALSQTALVLTSDGIAVTPMRANVPRPPDVRMQDGSVASSAIIREYPEVGLLFIRVSGSFPAPALANSNEAAAGMEGVAVSQAAIPGTDSIREVTIESLAIADQSYQLPIGLSRIAMPTHEIPVTYSGTPLYRSDRKVMGMLYPVGGAKLSSGISFSIIPITLIETALQDVLRYPNENGISVFSGINGEWDIHEAHYSPVFEVQGLTQGAPFAKAGVRSGDRIIGQNGETFDESGMLWGSLVQAARKGEPIQLDIERDGERMEVSIEFEL